MNGLLGVRVHCLDLSGVTQPPGNVTNLWGSKQVGNCVRLRIGNKVVKKKESIYNIPQKSPEKFLLIRRGKTCLKAREKEIHSAVIILMKPAV